MKSRPRLIDFSLAIWSAALVIGKDVASNTEGVFQFEPRVTPWVRVQIDRNPEGVGQRNPRLPAKIAFGLANTFSVPFASARFTPGFYPGRELENTFGVQHELHNSGCPKTPN
jgi:hypothetical protein